MLSKSDSNKANHPMPVEASVSDGHDFQFPSHNQDRAHGCFISFSRGQTAVRVNKELRRQLRETAGLEGDLFGSVVFDGEDVPWLAVTETPGEVDEDLSSFTDRGSEMRLNSSPLARLLCARFLEPEEERGRLHYTYTTTEQGPLQFFQLQEEEPERWC